MKRDPDYYTWRYEIKDPSPFWSSVLCGVSLGVIAIVILLWLGVA